MQFKTLRKTLWATEMIIRVNTLDAGGEIMDIESFRVSYVNQSPEDFNKAVTKMDSIAKAKVKYVGTTGNYLDITVEITGV